MAGRVLSWETRFRGMDGREGAVEDIAVGTGREVIADGVAVENILCVARVLKVAVSVEEGTDIVDESGADGGLLGAVTSRSSGGGEGRVGRAEGAGQILLGEKLEVGGDWKDTGFGVKLLFRRHAPRHCLCRHSYWDGLKVRRKSFPPLVFVSSGT